MNCKVRYDWYIYRKHFHQLDLTRQTGHRRRTILEAEGGTLWTVAGEG